MEKLTVDQFFEQAGQWRDELARLRTIMLASGLTEELKWYRPCYTFGKRNVALLYGLKDACGVAFTKGVLLKDERGLLGQPGKHTQAGRWMKFTSARQLAELTPTLKSYLAEAIEIEKAGREVEYKTEPEPMPEELRDKLAASPTLRHAFEALTPGRQRGYILHFSAAKQSTTRSARIDKYAPRILAGKGMHDY